MLTTPKYHFRLTPEQVFHKMIGGAKHLPPENAHGKEVVSQRRSAEEIERQSLDVLPPGKAGGTACGPGWLAVPRES
jgi:hypothetical protein